MTTQELLSEWRRRESGSREETGSPTCPTCQAILPKRPKRKTACAKCRSAIVVRRGMLCTADEGFLLSWFESLEYLGATPDRLVRVQAELRGRSTEAPSARDVVWALMNYLLTGNGRPELSSQIYQSMARLVREEGQDPKPYQALAAETELRELSLQHVRKVRVLGTADDYQCRQCRALADRILSVAEALRELPVPKQCTSEYGCRCIYLGEI